MSSEPEQKRQRTALPHYELLYHPVIPGRGEFVRLALEAGHASYTDLANGKGQEGYKKVQDVISPSSIDDAGGSSSVFAPPALRVPGEGRDGKSDLYIAQTANILLYLGPRLGLTPEDETGRIFVNQLTLTALDLTNEAHDSHHPIGMGAYYEDQKEEALQRSKEFRDARIPKYLSFFEDVLKGNEQKGQGKYLVDDRLTYADLTLWQVVAGLQFAFPNEIEHRKKDYPLIFTKFFPGIKEESGIKDYLSSDRRLASSNHCVFRNYPELDRQ